MLDVGYAGSQRCHIEMLKTLPGDGLRIGIDPERAPGWVAKEYDYCLRESVVFCSLGGDTVDLVWCISTLEHLPRMLWTEAVRQMVRVLKPEGRMLLTVPFGKAEEHAWGWNFDASMVDLVLKWMPGGRAEYFRHDEDVGWVPSERGDLSGVGYYGQNNAGAAAVAALMIG